MPHTTNEEVRDEIAFALCAFLKSCPEFMPNWHNDEDVLALADAVIPVIEQHLEDARMFRWIAQNSTMSWSEDGQTAQVCFPLQADMFETVEEAVRRAIGDDPEETIE